MSKKLRLLANPDEGVLQMLTSLSQGDEVTRHVAASLLNTQWTAEERETVERVTEFLLWTARLGPHTRKGVSRMLSTFVERNDRRTDGGDIDFLDPDDVPFR